MNEFVQRLADSVKRRRDAELQRCAKACFQDELGEISLEGQRLLADLRKVAKLFDSGIMRNAKNGALDRDELIRIEGRREIVLRLFALLDLDPAASAVFVEVERTDA